MSAAEPELPLNDHVQRAEGIKKRLRQYQTLFLVKDMRSGRYYLAARMFQGPEVEWEEFPPFLSTREADDICQKGICDFWGVQ